MIQRLTPTNLIREIARLNRDNFYNYIDRKNNGRIKIIDVCFPEGPIKIIRWNPTNNQTESHAKPASISKAQIKRFTTSLVANQPINLDRLFAGSYNTRSAFEAILAHTQEFYFCYPGRIEIATGSSPTVVRGHKHIIWNPDNPHELGITANMSTNIVISEAPPQDTFVDIATIPSPDVIPQASDVDPDLARTHAMMQVFLYNIGRELGFRTWIAQNDRGIIYQNRRIIEHEGVINSLDSEPLIQNYPSAAHAARLIDCVWFKNGRLMPAVIEVENSTGVTSGLHRMKTFKDIFPPFPTRYVVVAPDSDRSLVVRESNNPIYRDLNTRFFSYSAVNDLHNLIQKRKLRGITEDFLDSFMEPVVSN